MKISLSKYCAVTEVKLLLGEVAQGPDSPMPEMAELLFSGITWMYGCTDAIWSIVYWYIPTWEN